VDNTFTATADATGIATAVVQPGPPSTLTWVIAQISIETDPFRAGAAATITRNGRLVTSSSIASADTAYGPPAVAMNSGDNISCTWAGLQAGDVALMTIWFSEQPYGAAPDPNIVV
jgi:hypothetical protein